MAHKILRGRDCLWLLGALLTSSASARALPKTVALASSCELSNISNASASAFHAAYTRGWSGRTGHAAVRAFRPTVEAKTAERGSTVSASDIASYAKYYYTSPLGPECTGPECIGRRSSSG